MKIFTKGSILIGIAIDKGLINDLSERIVGYFPKILAGQEDIRKNELTIEHFLTMSAGFDWVEDNKGINRGADGLKLTPIDMAKIGLLYLHKGK